jgi:DinB family protein
MSLDRLRFALHRIHVARVYTLPLIETVRSEDWFKMPNGITHLAWQVGHLASAPYGLMIRAVRGKPEAGEVLPGSYFGLFGRGTKPMADPTAYPKPDELLRVLHAVNEAAPRAIEDIPDGVLDEPSLIESPMFKTKFDALVFCSEHEFSHAGQVGLLRRMLGYDSLR